MSKKYPALLKQFGKRIKELREEDQITQAKLAQRCGIDVRSIQRIESGDYSINLRTVFALSEAFGMPPYDLLTRIECSWSK